MTINCVFFAKNNENWANMIILIEYYGFLTEMMDGTENAEFETKITESQWQNMVNDGFGGKKNAEFGPW